MNFGAGTARVFELIQHLPYTYLGFICLIGVRHIVWGIVFYDHIFYRVVFVNDHIENLEKQT